MKSSNKKKKHIISKILGSLSLISFVVFSVFLLMLDMLPIKYITIYFFVFVVLYLIFLSFIFVRKIKNKFRIIAVVFLSVFGLVFGIGIKYLSDTIGFMDVINKKLLQKEIYYVMTLENSVIDNIKDLKNQKIGLYNSLNSEHALDELEKKVNIRSFEYKDVIEMFEDLENGRISAVLINDSVKTLLSSELDDMKLFLKEVEKVFVSIEKEDIVKIVDVTKKTFNIYVAGGDAYGSIENVTNTDVNMIITVNPKERKLLLTSIPRDYYIKLPSFGENAYDKLTHAGYYGIEESVKAIENLLDMDINYYIKVNFSTIEKIIDSIGGIDVYNDYEFRDNAFRKYYFKVGMIHMNGNMALAFAREREAYIDGDIQRVKNQQKVIEAIINKATSSTAIITNFSGILDSVSESLSTNMDTKSINRFVKMQLNDMRGWNIESNNLVGTDLYTIETYTFPGTNLYVMQQDEESVTNAKDKIKEYMK